MIDDPAIVEQLIEELSEHLPFTAALKPELADRILKDAPETEIPRQCQVTWVHYNGDDGGIMCKVDLPTDRGSRAIYTSLTYLVVRPGMLLSREISAYQKHRIKRLRRSRR